MDTGRLTTHVLDTARGAPANGLTLALYWLGVDFQPGARTLVIETTTNDDGRTDTPLLAGAAFKQGVYELEFHAGAYLRWHHTALATQHSLLFLDTIPIRFGLADSTKHYHVPLLLSPYGYSTYRGS